MSGPPPSHIKVCVEGGSRSLGKRQFHFGGKSASERESGVVVWTGANARQEVRGAAIAEQKGEFASATGSSAPLGIDLARRRPHRGCSTSELFDVIVMNVSRSPASAERSHLSITEFPIFPANPVRHTEAAGRHQANATIRPTPASFASTFSGQLRHFITPHPYANGSEIKNTQNSSRLKLRRKNVNGKKQGKGECL